MELTRRDVLAALAAAGAGVGGGAVLLSESESDAIGDHEVETLVAVASVVYPNEVGGADSFARKYSVNRVRDRPEYAEGIADAVHALDDYAQAWHDDDFASLDRETRESALDGMDVDVADPVPGGTNRERVRYYLVNELLYALFTTPTGGELAGIENPQGHPGGTTTYQRGPE